MKTFLKKYFPFLLKIREIFKFYSQKHTATRYIYGLLFCKTQLNHKLKHSKYPSLYFIHIPKNAGTSIIAILTDNSAGHWRLSELEKLNVDIKHKQIIYVTRNPYDRLLSAYNYFLHTSEEKMMKTFGYKKINKEIQKYKDFKDFVLNIDNFKYKWVWHFDTQTSFILNTQDNYDLRQIRYESLQEDYAQLAEDYQLSPLPHKNKSRDTQKERQHYTKEIAQAVFKRFREDFELFEYREDSWKDF